MLCKLSCYSKKLESLGIDSDEWLECAINLKKVSAIKSTGDGDGDESIANKAVLYLVSGDAFVTDIKYSDAVEMWIEAMVNTKK